MRTRAWVAKEFQWNPQIPLAKRLMGASCNMNHRKICTVEGCYHIDNLLLGSSRRRSTVTYEFPGMPKVIERNLNERGGPTNFRLDLSLKQNDVFSRKFQLSTMFGRRKCVCVYSIKYWIVL